MQMIGFSSLFQSCMSKNVDTPSFHHIAQIFAHSCTPTEESRYIHRFSSEEKMTAALNKPERGPRDPCSRHHPTATATATSRFEQLMFWSLIPATVVLPAWLVGGRTLLGGPRGWGSLVLMCTGAPILCLYHILLLVVYMIKNQRRRRRRRPSTIHRGQPRQRRRMTSHGSSPHDKNHDDNGSPIMISIQEYSVGDPSAFYLAVYYGVSFLVQCFMKDGDDHGSVASLATERLGISGTLSSDIGWFLVWASVALGVELLFLALVQPLPGQPRQAFVHHCWDRCRSRMRSVGGDSWKKSVWSGLQVFL